MAKQKVSAALPQAVPQPAQQPPAPNDAPKAETLGDAWQGVVITPTNAEQYGLHGQPEPTKAAVPVVSPDPGAERAGASVPPDGEAR